MSSTGYLQIYTYTGNARIPLENTAIRILDSKGTFIRAGSTDSNGKFGPIPISVPDAEYSLSPNPSAIPFGTIQINARKNNYEQIEATNVQIFAGITTTQGFEMIPLSELPDSWTKFEYFNTPEQNL